MKTSTAKVREDEIKRKKGKWKLELSRNKYYYLLILLPIIYYIVFRYLPMAGNVIAFRKYYIGMSIFGEDWVGLRYFELVFKDGSFWIAFKNTLVLSVLNLVIGFPIPIIFALLLNEIRNNLVKRSIQTISYLPKFISTVVAVSMIKEMCSPSTGIINQILKIFGVEPIFFVNEPDWFRFIYIASDLWQFMGWNAIIYIAALAGVDQAVYEAAMVDGAGRFKQTIHVTLPGIMPTIIVTLILQIGRFLSLGFEKVLLLYTPMNSINSDILDTYVYRMGLQNHNFSYAAAVGLFTSVVGLILIVGSNKISKKITGMGIY